MRKRPLSSAEWIWSMGLFEFSEELRDRYKRGGCLGSNKKYKNYPLNTKYMGGKIGAPQLD